jgi:hypothetical protein
MSGTMTDNGTLLPSPEVVQFRYQRRGPRLCICIGITHRRELEGIVPVLHPRELQLGIPPDSACFLVLNRTLLNRTLP